MLWRKSVIKPSSVNGNAFPKEPCETAFSDALWFEGGNGWGAPQLLLAALVVWRVVEHRPALVSKCCWSASAASPGVVSCQKWGAERWDLCSCLKRHKNLWSAATVLYCSLGWFPCKPHVRNAPEATAGNSSAYFRAWVGEWGVETRGLCAGRGCSEWASPYWPGHVCQQRTCSSLPRSCCYHHIAYATY